MCITDRYVRYSDDVCFCNPFVSYVVIAGDRPQSKLKPWSPQRPSFTFTFVLLSVYLSVYHIVSVSLYKLWIFLYMKSAVHPLYSMATALPRMCFLLSIDLNSTRR